MLTFYNESKNKWRLKKLNERVSKISTMIKLDDDKKKFINLLISNDIELSNDCDVSEIAEFGNCVTVSTDNTAVKFQKKDLNPTIISSDKYNNDVLFITIRLNGRIVRDIDTYNAAILSHFIAKGNLILIVSLRENNGHYGFNLTLHNNKTFIDTKYTFNRIIENGEDYEVIVEDTEVGEENVIAEPTYKIYNFRPLRPTHAILVNTNDEKAFHSACKYEKNHNVLLFSNADELKVQIDKLIEDKYRAVTLFVNRERSSQPVDTQYTDIVKTNFRYVNYLFNTGKVSIVK